MLDVSIRAGILNRLNYFSNELNMGILYIAHDLSTMNHICDSIGIMYLGKIVEMGKTQQVLGEPKHPYTQALVSAIPLMGGRFHRKRIILEGAVPSPINLPEGCRFQTRCPKVVDNCRQQEPELIELKAGHLVACSQI